VVTLDALEPFRCSGPEQFPHVLPYLAFEGDHNFDIMLEASIQPADGDSSVLSRTNFKYMYWNMAQQLAHHTINGCNLQVGDMYASGTISGPSPGSFGSMLELSWNGKKKLHLEDGTERTFIEDGDTIILKGFAEKEGVRIGFGECRGTVFEAV
jgi:fumarylacetoacetase